MTFCEPLGEGQILDYILCYREMRSVHPGETISYRGKIYKSPLDCLHTWAANEIKGERSEGPWAFTLAYLW
ncbi:hypothetical protein JDF658_25200 [Carboxydocella sp. JDF658]|nr:hypothetical protein JDF658_25200 [Carboxydocella sp. JDF658]